MRKNLAKHTAKKLPLAKRVLALCFALIFVCSCLLPAFANGTGEGLDTPDTEVVEAADPGTEPEPMDLSDEPAAMDDDFAVADEPAALDDDFAVADEPAALDDDFAVADEPAAMDDDFAMGDEPAAMDDQVEKPVVDDEPAAMDNEVEKPVEGGEPPVADDTPAEEGATKTTTDASGNTVYEYDTSGTTFPEDDAAALPDGDQVLDQMDAAFSIPTNIYHFWLKKMSSYDLADIAADAETAEMTVEQYLAMYGTDKGCYHIMTAADGANLKDYQFADPTSNDDPEGNSRTFAGWYYTDELGDEQKFVFDEFLYISEGTTVEVYAKWTDEEDEEAEETKKDDPAAAQKAKFKQWYQNLVDCTSEYTLKSLAEEYFATEGFYTYLGSLPDEEQEALWDKLEPVNQPKDDTAEYEEETQDDGIALLSITAPDSVWQIHVGKKLVLTSDLKDYGGWESDGYYWHYRNYTAEHEWTSSEPSVATVESGVLYQTEKATVTGVSVGQTIITHTAKGYYVDNSGNKHYDTTTHTDTYTIQVVQENVDLGSDNGAQIYILKTPTSDPKSNATNQWTDKHWDGKVNTYGAEWTDNKNIFSYPAQYVTQWPDETTNSYWLLKNTDKTKYFNDVRTEIFSAYKSSIEDQIKEQLEEQGQTVTDIDLKEDDITQIKVTPYKISRNNGTKPDKHIDCTIDIVNDKVYTAKFWVMEPNALKYEMKDSTTYLKGYEVRKTSQATIGTPTTVDGVTYVLKGWYKEKPNYMGAADEPNAADETKLITTWDYMPSEEELADGTVNFYAVYDRVNTDFTVKKEVTGWFGDKTKQFTFKIESADLSNHVTVKKNNEVVEASNFTLGDGETVTVSGIPADTIITVTETLSDTGYNTTASGFEQPAQTTDERIFRYKFVQEGEKFVLKPVDQDGNVTGDEVSSNTIVVQNEKEGEIDNGVLLDTLPYILILVVVVGGGVLLFLRKRKNDDE